MKINSSHKLDSDLIVVSESAVDGDRLSELITGNKQLRKQLYQMRNLLNVSLEVNSLLEEKELLRSYGLNLLGLLSTRCVAILTDSAHPNEFAPVYQQGMTKQQAKELALNRSNAIFDFFTKSENIIDLQNSNKHNIASEYLRTAASVGINAITPIIHREELLGIVMIGDKHNHRPLSEPEIEMFQTLTKFLAVAIHNSRMYKEKERMSLTDPLTGLFNRRYLETHLQHELSRARRFSHPLSLVMMDVDDFKNYNDRLGHPTGDSLLRQLADELKEATRCSDIIARYGGEEFCIILPQHPQSEAIRFSERIRKVIFKYPFKQREIQPRGHITISVGTATFPNDAHLMQDLIEKADAALYIAKKHGRNQVASYGLQNKR